MRALLTWQLVLLLTLALVLLAGGTELVQQQQPHNDVGTCEAGAACQGRRLQSALQFPPANWTTVQYNWQWEYPFNLSAHVLPDVSIYMMTSWSNVDNATVQAMRTQGLLPVCIVQ
jgi:hypothetical protein